ncbi:unnamed protein product [Amoebophrya sp. A25]|nr:unnamed protein product [Amoebophrya sp. A25]|eukprot:GSA25T00027552001.1
MSFARTQITIARSKYKNSHNLSCPPVRFTIWNINRVSAIRTSYHRAHAPYFSSQHMYRYLAVSLSLHVHHISRLPAFLPKSRVSQNIL